MQLRVKYAWNAEHIWLLHVAWVPFHDNDVTDAENKREISNKTEMIAVGSQSNIVLQLKRTCPRMAISIRCRKRNMFICA